MILRAPFEISSRLLAAVQVGGATISIDMEDRDCEGRTLYRAWIDLPDGREFEIDAMKSGCQGGSIQEGMACLLTFLDAAAESRAYSRHTGEPGENEDLFAPEVVTWADEHSDAISMLACEIEETPDLVTD